MRRWFLLLVLISIITSCSSPINKAIEPAKPPQKLSIYNDIKWQQFDEKALLKAKLQNKLILIYLFSPTCSYCNKMERAAFTDPEIINLMNNYFVCSSVNGEENENINNALNAGGVFPTTVFLSPGGVDLISINGFVNTVEYKKALKKILSVAKESGLSAP